MLRAPTLIALLALLTALPALGQTVAGATHLTGSVTTTAGTAGPATMIVDTGTGRAAAIVRLGDLVVAINLELRKEASGFRYYSGEVILPDGTRVKASLVTGGNQDPVAGASFANPQIAGTATFTPAPRPTVP